MLSKRQIEDICLVYQGAHQCRYLEGDSTDYSKFYCRKRTPDRAVIDEVVDDHIKERIRLGKDPMTEDEAIGDNCSLGFLPFKDKLQGYDVGA